MTSPNQFDYFWMAYPHKVAKIAAQKAYVKALKVTTPEEILDGVAKYKKFKPESQSWCHAASWLNGFRWQDVWKSEPVKPQFKQPNEIDVLRYARDKGADLELAKQWHWNMVRRAYKINGRMIDWKIVFSEEFSKART